MYGKYITEFFDSFHKNNNNKQNFLFQYFSQYIWSTNVLTAEKSAQKS